MGAPTRATKSLQVTIAANAAESDAIHMAEFAAGIVVMPAAWDAADLGLKVCGSSDGTFVALKDWQNAYGQDVSVDGAAASTAYPLPLLAFAAPYIKLWSHNGEGTDTDQTAKRTLTVFLKA